MKVDKKVEIPSKPQTHCTIKYKVFAYDMMLQMWPFKRTHLKRTHVNRFFTTIINYNRILVAVAKGLLKKYWAEAQRVILHLFNIEFFHYMHQQKA